MRDDEYENPKSGRETLITVLIVLLCAAVLVGATLLIVRAVSGGKDDPVTQEMPTDEANEPDNKDGQTDSPQSTDEGDQNTDDDQNADSSGQSTDGDSQSTSGGHSNNDGSQAPGNGSGPEAGMNFQEVNETVTAKEVTNLRNIPSQGADSTVLRQLSNGETATRTGVSDQGWSRLVLDGTTYYAVSSFLTTDLSYRPPEPEAQDDDGIKTQFTPCQEQVTPKIEINLRSIPSVTNPEAVVVATAYAGEVFTRTGINTDVGWSRVEYNGQVLYCVSSYLEVVEQ